MKKLGVVAIVAVGLLTLVWAVEWISYTISTVKTYGNPQEFVISLLPFIGCLVLSALLILNRQRLAERWFQDGDIGISLGAVSLLRLGLIIIGVYLIIDAIPSALKSVSESILQATQDRLIPPMFLAHDQLLWVYLQRLVFPAVELCMGLLLIARSQSLASYLWVGRKVVVEPEEPALPKCPACGTPFDPAEYKGGMITARCSACNEPLDLERFR